MMYEVGNLITLNTIQDMYGGVIQESTPYRILQVLQDGILLIERLDSELYYGDRTWIVETEYVENIFIMNQQIAA